MNMASEWIDAVINDFTHLRKEIVYRIDSIEYEEGMTEEQIENLKIRCAEEGYKLGFKDCVSFLASCIIKDY